MTTMPADISPAAVGQLAALPFLPLLLFRNGVVDCLTHLRRNSRYLPPGDWRHVDKELARLGSALGAVLEQQQSAFELEHGDDH
ncbi:hypothetical protein IGB42_02641 [Andreprevotia sp. IGB-42]|nr:hypothetical protein IGB42_02641 [Andreprevotia sp. IGB-42]